MSTQRYLSIKYAPPPDKTWARLIQLKLVQEWIDILVTMVIVVVMMLTLFEPECWADTTLIEYQGTIAKPPVVVVMSTMHNGWTKIVNLISHWFNITLSISSRIHPFVTPHHPLNSIYRRVSYIQWIVMTWNNWEGDEAERVELIGYNINLLERMTRKETKERGTMSWVIRDWSNIISADWI